VLKGDPVMPDLSLLIQLFGRETMDRLTHAGFETPRTIVRAGPERLAAECGVDLTLACRIAAAALEALAAEEIAAGADVEVAGAAEAGAPETGLTEAGLTGAAVTGAVVTAPGPAAAPRRAGKTEKRGRTDAPDRHSRRPLKPAVGSHSLLPEKAPESVPVTPPENVTLIDDAGLVSWMGFTSRPGTGRAMSFSVSDAILDGGAPAVAPSGDRQPAEEPKAAAGATAAPPPMIEGSFWSFGQRPEGGVRAPKAGAEEGRDVKRMARRATDGVAGPRAGLGVPRRRRHDEQ
jgi:hypothetical protein